MEGSFECLRIPIFHFAIALDRKWLGSTCGGSSHTVPPMASSECSVPPTSAAINQIEWRNPFQKLLLLPLLSILLKVHYSASQT